MTYLPAQVKISWKIPHEVEDINAIEVYRYRKELSRCEDYIELGEKIHETNIIIDGECTDEIKSASSWSYAVFCKNEVSLAPCVAKIHTVYPDKDFDGIEDSVDPFLNDTDNDGIGNKCDADFPRNIFKNDTDGDGIINDCDPDDDNDGVLDEDDPFPWHRNKKLKVIIGDTVVEKEYPEGANVGLVASPNTTDGELFLRWLGEVDDPTSLTTSVSMHRDQEVIASFGVIENELTVGQKDDLGNESTIVGTVQGAGQRVFGQRVGVIATANEGYQFKEWQTDNNEVEIGDIYNQSSSFLMPNSDVHIYAVFEPDPCFNFTVIIARKHSNDQSDPNGEAEAFPVGGTPPYAYKWYGKTGSTNKIDELISGPYSIEVTDSNGCKATENFDIKDVSVDPCEGFSVNVVNVKHNTQWRSDLYDGSILVEAVGGVGPYTYVWTGGTGGDTGPFAGATNRKNELGQNVDPYGLGPGPYVVTITDSRGCVAKKQINVEQNALDPCRDFNGVTHLAVNNTAVVGSDPFQNNTSAWLDWWKANKDYKLGHDWDDPDSPFVFVNLVEKLVDLGYLTPSGVLGQPTNQAILEVLNIFKSIATATAASPYRPDGSIDYGGVNTWEEFPPENRISNKWNDFVRPWAGIPVEDKFGISIVFGNNRIDTSDLLVSDINHNFKIPFSGTRHPIVFIKGSKNLPSEINENTTYYAQAFGSGSNYFKIYSSKTSSIPISFKRHVDIKNPANNEDLGSHYCQTTVKFRNPKNLRTLQPLVLMSHMLIFHGINRHGGYGDGINFARYWDGKNFNHGTSFFGAINDVIKSISEYGRSHYLESAMQEVVNTAAVNLQMYNGSITINFDGGAEPISESVYLETEQRYYIDGNSNIHARLSIFAGLNSWDQGGLFSDFQTGKGTWANLPPGKYSYNVRDNNTCPKGIEDISIN